MASRLLPQWYSSRCIGSSALNSTCRTEVCHRFLSGSSPRPGSIPLPFYAPVLTGPEITAPIRRVFMQPRIGRENFSDFHSAEPTHPAADGFCSVHCDRVGRWALSAGFDSVCSRRIQRRAGWFAGSQTASADFARSISRSHRGQAFVEHDVSGALHSAQDSVEVYGAGLQPRYFHSGRQRCALRDCRSQKFSAQHFWKSEYIFTNRRRILCDAFLYPVAALDRDHAPRVLARNLCLYDCFRVALCFSRATSPAYAHSFAAFASPRRSARQLTHFPPAP